MLWKCWRFSRKLHRTGLPHGNQWKLQAGRGEFLGIGKVNKTNCRAKVVNITQMKPVRQSGKWWRIFLEFRLSLAGWVCPCERGSGMWKIPLFYLNRILNFNSESITRIIVWDSRKLKRNQICRRKIPPVLRLVGPGIICLDHHLAPIWRLFSTSPVQTYLLIKHSHLVSESI